MAQGIPDVGSRRQSQKVPTRIVAIPHALDRKARKPQVQQDVPPREAAPIDLGQALVEEAQADVGVQEEVLIQLVHPQVNDTPNEEDTAVAAVSYSNAPPITTLENGAGEEHDDTYAVSETPSSATKVPIVETGLDVVMGEALQPSVTANNVVQPDLLTASERDTAQDINIQPSEVDVIFGGRRESANSSTIMAAPDASASQRLESSIRSAHAGAPRVGASRRGNPNLITPFVPSATNWRPPRDFQPAGQLANINARQPYPRYHMPQAPSVSSYMPRYNANLPYPDIQHHQFHEQQHYPYDQFTPMPSEFAPAHRMSLDGTIAPPSMKHGQQQQQQPPQAGNPMRHNSVPALPGSPDLNIDIGNYIHAQFGNREFSDYIVQLSHSRYLFPPATIPAHGIILARSPKLRSLMRMQNSHGHATQNYPRFLAIACSDRFLTHEVAFLKAVMRLYGEPLPSADTVYNMPVPCHPVVARQEAMRFALSYAAAGHFLEADDIITHALDLSREYMTWDTIGSALAFALEGGLSPVFVSDSSSEDIASSSSSLDDAKLDSQASTPTYGIYSERMLHQVIGFLTEHWPKNFSLFAGAVQLPDIARLPAIAEPGALPQARTELTSPSNISSPAPHSRTGSRLSSIRFGDMAAIAAETMPEPVPAPPVTTLPDTQTVVLSSILISLPYALLKYLFEATLLSDRIGASRMGDIIRVVVEEREQRRRRAYAGRLAASDISPQSPAEERLWRNVRWVERVESVPQTTSPLGLKLVRHVGGVETPGSGESQTSG